MKLETDYSTGRIVINNASSRLPQKQKMRNTGMKVQNLSVLAKEETIVALEKIANDPDVQIMDGRRLNSGTNLRHRRSM